MAQPKKTNPNADPATKADIESFKKETKADLESFRKETKSDIESLKKETKSDLESFRKETKSDIQAFKSEITLAFLKHEQKNDRQFEKIENLILSTKSEILNAVDASAGQIKDTDRLQAMQGQHLYDHDKTLKDHEGRIKRLETPAFPPA
ncbi:MAG: hypothetical protein HY747_01530 [Elusimicrobia bacterium]|nr:hypothetical protein [Elusimicrobiota bacterium]